MTTYMTMDPSIEQEIEAVTGQDTAEEPPYKVIIHNDDVTPMDFVIYVLLYIFKLPHVFAEAVMWEAHNNGEAIVGVWPKPEAQSKVRRAEFMARMEGYPLKLTLEEA